ncbi:unnamed protein product [Nippostrongylus brasiliensis]|uniref:Uncharacterized protein n=1 Tax=Nippostrongylus brasiliensis TaxID=27835 RepID=A0A0N4YT12_NIPBR|nr:unnamed protein product [Nippostrongylus brasiliensis]
MDGDVALERWEALATSGLCSEKSPQPVLFLLMPNYHPRAAVEDLTVLEAVKAEPETSTRYLATSSQRIDTAATSWLHGVGTEKC